MAEDKINYEPYSQGFINGRNYAVDTMIEWARTMSDRDARASNTYRLVITKALRLKDDLGTFLKDDANGPE